MRQLPSIKAFLWFLFSGAATFSAFILPIFLWTQWKGYQGKEIPIPGGTEIFLFVTAFCAIYHGLYRTKTIIFDLGFPRAAKISGIIFFLIATPALAWYAYVLASS